MYFKEYAFKLSAYDTLLRLAMEKGSILEKICYVQSRSGSLLA